MLALTFCLFFYASISFVLIRRAKNGIEDPVVTATLVGGLVIFSQIYDSKLIDSPWASYSFIVFCLLSTAFVLLLLLVKEKSLAVNPPIRQSDWMLGFFTLGIGFFAFVYLIYYVGGLNVYFRRVEGASIEWEGAVAALAFLTSLSHFGALLFLSFGFRFSGYKRHASFILSIIGMLPTIFAAILLFRRTALFVFVLYLLYVATFIKGKEFVARYIKWGLVIVPLVAFTIIQGLPYLRTQYFQDISKSSDVTFEDYSSMTIYNESEYGVSVVDSLSKGCSELGYGRRFLFEMVRVFIPKASGIKLGMLSSLSFEDLRVCSNLSIPETSFFTGIGEAVLDFGYFAPFSLFIYFVVAVKTSRFMSLGSRSAYMVYLSSYAPLFFLYGPVSVYGKVVPVIIISLFFSFIFKRV